MELLAEVAENEPSLHDVVMYIDLKKCIGCFGCETSCKLEHDLGMGPRLMRVMQVGPKRVRGRLKTLYIPMPCMHCNPAACIDACPTGAVKRRAKDGIVYVDTDACIGCKRCMQACPYGAAQYDTRSGRAVKCDFCMKRVDYKKTYKEEDIKRIYRYALKGGRTIREVVYERTGHVKRDSKGRLVDEKGKPLSGKALSESVKMPKEIGYEGLWPACATKCSTEAMTFGYMKDLRDFIEKMKEKRDVRRVGSIYYGFPKDDFPYPATR